MTNEEKRTEAVEWVNAGKPCKYRHGLSFRGARAGKISTEEAKRMLSDCIVRQGKRHYTWTFGMSFNELHWEEDRTTHERYLVFNEYSENDLY